MEFSRKDTEVGSHSLLQGLVPTQEWNPGLLADSLSSDPPGKCSNKLITKPGAGVARGTCPVLEQPVVAAQH